MKQLSPAYGPTGVFMSPVSGAIVLPGLTARWAGESFLSTLPRRRPGPVYLLSPGSPRPFFVGAEGIRGDAGDLFLKSRTIGGHHEIQEAHAAHDPEAAALHALAARARDASRAAARAESRPEISGPSLLTRCVHDLGPALRDTRPPPPRPALSCAPRDDHRGARASEAGALPTRPRAQAR